MIVDGILFVFQNILSILLLPLTAINITIDFLSGIPIVTSFLQVVAFIMPWDNILPLIALSFGIILFKVFVSLIKTIWDLIPIL